MSDGEVNEKDYVWGCEGMKPLPIPAPSHLTNPWVPGRKHLGNPVSGGGDKDEDDAWGYEWMKPLPIPSPSHLTNPMLNLAA